MQDDESKKRVDRMVSLLNGEELHSDENKIVEDESVVSISDSEHIDILERKYKTNMWRTRILFLILLVASSFFIYYFAPGNHRHGHSHSGYADDYHSHSRYADDDHSHSRYADDYHSHSWEHYH